MTNSAIKMTVLDYVDLDARGRIIRGTIDTRKREDHGCDPLGPDQDGVFKWRMVPSGDVVDAAERDRRLPPRGRLTTSSNI